MTHPLVAEVEQAILRERLIRPGDHVVVGVSGGPDSMALLHVLLALRGRLSATVSVAHVDHQLRPESSDDARRVETIAQELGVRVTVVRRDVASAAAAQGWSVEDAARRVRYAAFEDAARQHGADRIAVAHTADDQAETVLLRLCRGAGVTGLSAMASERPLGQARIIRPFLRVWRAQVSAYLAEERIPSSHDASNDDTRFVRNRLRHELLPWLQERVNPNIKAALVQLADQCRDDAAFLASAAQRQWKRLVKWRGSAMAIRLAPFRRQPRAMQAQLLRMAIAALRGDLTGFEYRHWLEIEQLCAARPAGSVVDLPGALRVGKEPEHLVLWTGPMMRAGSGPRLIQRRLVDEPLATQHMECG